jgi:hypothetical protein
LTSEVSSAAASSTAEPVPRFTPSKEKLWLPVGKNIRDSIAGTAAKPAPTKEEFRDVEPAPVDHNAVAPVEPSTRQFKASDPTSIANIVDSGARPNCAPRSWKKSPASLPIRRRIKPDPLQPDQPTPLNEWRSFFPPETRS